MNGKVYLVGAGPGDKGLLTLKAAKLISEAEVVVYDRLVGSDIMAMVPSDAELINVGKNVGDHPVPQHRINEILVEQAKMGKNVVRLKGGDPFIFGRGGEELELITENGIEFEEVPGITSSVAAPAYAGIPVTHRDFCSSLHIITGHAKAGSQVDIDFDALNRLNGTLIFMMSVASIPQIAEGLLKAGMEADMPCAVIENGTRPNQRKFVSELSKITQVVKENKVISPSVIMVGKVCSLSDSFDWYDNLPLKGRKVLVTQPANKNSRMGEGLSALGADVVMYPCVETLPIRPINPPFEDCDTLVFTSSEGVKSFCNWLLEDGRDVRALGGKKIAAIGSATDKELKKYGLRSDFIPSIFSGEYLGKEMVEQGFVDNESNVILLRTDIGSMDVVEILKDSGIKFLDYPVYETKNIPHDKIDDIQTYSMVVFTSRSGVLGFVKTQSRENFVGVKALCIGEQTAREAAAYGFDVEISEVATIESMLEKAVLI